MAQPEITVKMRWEVEDEAREAERRWPLSTLVAYLFEGRECDEVRALLATGRGMARLCELSWQPMRLTAAQLTAIERTFPQGMPEQPFDPGRATAVELKMPALHPTLGVPLRLDQAMVRAAAKRAAHLRFDYGPWADVYVATLTSAEASALLQNPARRVTDEGEAELAARVIGEDDASLYFTVPREGSPPPWTGSP